MTTNPEFSEQQFTSPQDWARRARNRIFPPTEGSALVRAVRGMNRLRNITWPNITDQENIDQKQIALTVFAHEFITQAFEDSPPTTLDLAVKRHEIILREMRRGINEAAENAPQLVGLIIGPENEEEVRMAIDAAINERKERFGAENEATQIIWKQTDPTDNHDKFRKIYRHNPGELPPSVQLLLRTAQDYLTWETFADRKGYGGIANIWGTLITMYILGMESYYIDPETDEFTLQIQVKKGGKTEIKSFTVPH